MSSDAKAVIARPAEDGSTVTKASGDAIERTRPQKIAAWTLSTFGFVTFYLLASGPMAALHKAFEFQGFRKAVEILYKPVVFLVKNDVEPLSSIMQWYIGLFR